MAPWDLFDWASENGFNASSVIVAFLVVSLSLFASFRWYRRRVAEIKEKEVLRVHFQPQQETTDPSVYQLDKHMQRWTDYLSIKRTYHSRYWSFGQYLRALRVENASKTEINPRAVSVSLVDALGYDLILPILTRSPYFNPESKHELKVSPEVKEIARLVFRDFVSPVVISAASSTLHKIGSGKRLRPVDSISHFKRGYTDTYKYLFDGLQIPNPLRFPEDIDGEFFQSVSQRHILRQTIAREKESKSKRQVHEKFLPNLYYGTTETYNSSATDKEFALSLVLALVFNKLSANSIPDLKPVFIVEIGGERCSTLDGFFRIVESIKVTAQSRLTTFSNSLVVRADQGDVDIPMLIPMRTGINTRDGKDEIVAPFFHTGLTISVTDKRISPFSNQAIDVDWYQDVGTYTGFMAPFERIWPWHAPFQREHWANSTKDKQVLALLACGELSAINNELVSELGLAAAGYGYTGVCNDSVALVEAATFGLENLSVFPLLLAGQGRTDMIRLVKKRIPSSKARQRHALQRILAAIENLPCDIDTTPKEVKDTCRRICAMLPEEEDCPFELISVVRRQTQEHFLGTHTIT